MAEKFTESGVVEQRKHKFISRHHNFTCDPHQYLTLIKSLEIHPASMVPQREVLEPFPGNFLISFIPETNVKGRVKVREALADKLAMTPRGNAFDDWFTFAPKDGVISHQLVQSVLATLHEYNAIGSHHVDAAAKEFGIPASGNPERPQDLRSASVTGTRPRP